MDVTNFTDKSKTTIATASNLAVQNKNSEIDIAHLILAMLDRKQNLIYQLLVKMDINVENLKIELEDDIATYPKVTGKVEIRFSRNSEKALEEAEKQAAAMKDEFISVEHLMLGAIENAPEAIKKILKMYRIDKNKFLKVLKDIRGNVNVKTDTPENSYDVLNKFGMEEIESVGKRFDPELHDAVSHIDDSSKGEQEIVEEYRKGYKIGNKVIRHSMVIVAN